MRPVVRLYALLLIAAAAGLAVTEVIGVASWTYAWSPLTGLALVAMYIVAVHFQFQVHSGWSPTASPVPPVATATFRRRALGTLVAGAGCQPTPCNRPRR